MLLAYTSTEPYQPTTLPFTLRTVLLSRPQEEEMKGLLQWPPPFFAAYPRDPFK